MKEIQNKVKEVNIAYIGGGSRGWAWKFMSDLVIEKDITGNINLYDIDFEAAKRNEIIGNKLNDAEGANTVWKYTAVKSLEAALSNANFVVISITPGTLDKEMRSDVHTGEKFGIYQSVGDTVGLGGYVRAMRTIPMYIEIAEAIKTYCPDSWVINYTNPMTLCVKTLYEVFPEIKAFGCCHEVFSTQNILAHAVSEKLEIELPERHEIEVNVQGINHFTWLDKAFYKGIDIYPFYKEFVDKYYETGYQTYDDEELDSTFKSLERVKFDLFKRYGVIAAAGDRHLVEFLPREWYLKNPEMVSKWSYKLTTVDDRIARLEKRNQKGDKLVNGEKKVEVVVSGEEGVQQIRAILGLRELVSNVNIPNYGQVPYLPIGAVVETNALFRSDNVQPLLVGDLKNDVKQLIIGHVYTQEAFIKAYFKEDKEAVFNAWLSDPMAKALDLVTTRKLFEEMLKNTKAYLPEWLIK